jgi:hypothetical protein
MTSTPRNPACWCSLDACVWALFGSGRFLPTHESSPIAGESSADVSWRAELFAARDMHEARMTTAAPPKEGRVNVTFLGQSLIAQHRSSCQCHACIKTRPALLRADWTSCYSARERGEK